MLRKSCQVPRFEKGAELGTRKFLKRTHVGFVCVFCSCVFFRDSDLKLIEVVFFRYVETPFLLSNCSRRCFFYLKLIYILHSAILCLYSQIFSRRLFLLRDESR